MSFKFLVSTLALALATPAAADVLVDNVEGLAIGEDGKLKRFTDAGCDRDLIKEKWAVEERGLPVVRVLQQHMACCSLDCLLHGLLVVGAGGMCVCGRQCVSRQR